ncbi:hypothetical protein EON83_03510 [bacterium]|nr:MAG: hypothetical protein EON83_03510 [bacterium]
MLTLTSAHAEPTQQGHLFQPGTYAKDSKLNQYRLSNMTLDYAHAPSKSTEVLTTKVSVTFKGASFLSALDALMSASDKTCRVECRQIRPQLVSFDVKNAPLAGMLDSLAKMGGARLYVLPSKLIIAPEKALSDKEKKEAQPYGVLLTSTTLPNTPQAKALLKPNAQGKTILDVANISLTAIGIGARLGGLISLPLDPYRLPKDEFLPKVLGPVSIAAQNSTTSFYLQDVNWGDALASFAHSVGCELYLTPENFIICAPDHLNDPEIRHLTQNAVPAFAPSSTNINFPQPSVSAS